MSVTVYIVDIVLNRDQLEAYYAGQVSMVWARSREGVRLQFPARLLRPFVTLDGVQGTFKMRVQGNRMVGIQRQQ